ncbi:hypothetical protein [Vibrio hyugaensis]|uniref:hypothetical protein n=1 Tax=Vibrio hyugaensis TaxID=1534743 RepID=UPI003DA00426
MKTLFSFLLLTFFSGVSTTTFASSKLECNDLELGVHYQFSKDDDYCIRALLEKVVIANLSDRPVDIEDVNRNTYTLYSNDYLVTTGLMKLNNVKGIVIGLESVDAIILRNKGDVNDVKPMVIPAAVFIPMARGAVLGVMAAVARDPNVGFRGIVIGAFAGAVTGGLAPIMGAGGWGAFGAGALGIAAGGACYECHQ